MKYGADPMIRTSLVGSLSPLPPYVSPQHTVFSQNLQNSFGFQCIHYIVSQWNLSFDV